MRPSPDSFETFATRFMPTYLIQPFPDGAGRRPRAPLLLGSRLSTTSIGCGGLCEKNNSFKVHVKSDAPRGVRMEGMQSARRDGKYNPYDSFGHIGGDRNYVERLVAGDFSFACDIEKSDRKLMIVRLTRIMVQEVPLLVVSRARLFHPKIAPQLKGKEADPFFKRRQIETTDLDFETLVAKVREHLQEEVFRFFP